MKKTLYFKTTTEVEEYYPNGVPSNVIAIVGEGSNVFISSDNENLKNQKFFNADLTNDEIVAEQVADAEQSGYNTGHAAGYSEGETAGYQSGYTAGEDAGYSDGYQNGVANGETDGYTAAEAVKNCLKFTNVNNSGASTIQLTYSAVSGSEWTELGNSIQFSRDGIHWELWGFSRVPLELENKGDFIYVKCGLGYFSKDASNYVKFIMTGKIAASGDITSLLNGTGGDVDLSANNRSYNFYSLFKDCTALTSAPKLPSTTLSRQCYGDMFYGCTSLTEAPELPATTLATQCYMNMFFGCNHLTTAPVLSAATLQEGSYQTMFYGCTALNSITCLAENTSASASTFNWLYGVAATGTFTKVGSMTSFSSDTSGIPSGWTVENYGDYDTGYTAGETAGQATGYQNGYTAGETAGYNSGYAAGQADGGANWIDVLYLDEKTNAETYLGITGTWPGDGQGGGFQKYNYYSGLPYDGALGLVQGLQSNKTLMKLIKITKDANDNSIVTSQAFNFNYDGTNIGSISIDGNTYSTKLCFWSTVTLAAGDEVILDCAAQIEYQGTTLALGLFGGYDANSSDPTTYKCETAGTYSFVMTIDPPQVPNGTASLTITTMFNYEGSATVPAIAVPTGETSGGGGSVSLTEEQLNQMSFGLTMQSIMQTGIDTPQLWQIDIDYMDTSLVTSAMASPTGMMVDIYNETSGLVEDYSFTFTGDDTNNYISAVVSLTAGDKVGFTLFPVMTDPGTGDNVLDSAASWLYRYVDPNNDGMGYNTHFYEADNTGDYEFKIQLITDDETGDWRIDSITFTEVVQP